MAMGEGGPRGEPPPAATGAGRRETLDALVARAQTDSPLRRTLGPLGLTALGIASVVGAGIFVLVGEAAADYAGPSVAVSFAIAGVAAFFTALCYAELASMIPVSGSTYSYAYAVMGGFLAWIIGWDLLLEYLFAACVVAVGWSGYLVDLLADMGVAIPAELVNAPFGDGPTGWVNVPAMLLMVGVTALLVAGVAGTVRMSIALVAVNLTVLGLFVVIGALFMDAGNWTPFIPPSEGGFGDFGWSGMLRAAGIVFFAFVGFDAVATAAQEARRPRTTVPIGLLGSVIVATLLYIAIALVLTGLLDYTRLGVSDPIAAAIAAAGPELSWLRIVTDVGAVASLAATTLVTMYGQTRILMRMAEDGMLPRAFARVSRRTRTPVFTTLVCGAVAVAGAGVLPLSVLADLVSVGTLLAFTIVCVAVLVLRRRRPDLPRPFKVPLGPVVPVLGFTSALAVMVTLPVSTFIRLGIWFAIGMAIYLLSGRARSRGVLEDTKENYLEGAPPGGGARAGG